MFFIAPAIEWRPLLAVPKAFSETVPAFIHLSIKVCEYDASAYLHEELVEEGPYVHIGLVSLRHVSSSV